MKAKVYSIKVSTKSTTNEQQYQEFDDWYSNETQRIKQERLLLEEIRNQHSIIKSKFKKITKEGVLLTGDFRKTFPEYYNKYFIPIKKKVNSDFVSFKYYTDDEKGDDEDSEDSETDEDYEDNDTKIFFSRKLNLCLKMDTPMKRLKDNFDLSTE
jgi:hypothetical protein